MMAIFSMIADIKFIEKVASFRVTAWWVRSATLKLGILMTPALMAMPANWPAILATGMAIVGYIPRANCVRVMIQLPSGNHESVSLMQRSMIVRPNAVLMNQSKS